MTVLVTGGAGFIGSNVVDLLIREGHDVAVLDNLSTGTTGNLNEDAAFYQRDITDDLTDVFKKEDIEFVLHQAAQIDVRKSITDPVFDANVNVIGSIKLLECCKDFGVKKVVYASSGGAVYGEPEGLPVDERHPISPLCPYGASKYSIEKYLDFYRAVHDLDFVVLRYGNVYGPRQDPFGEAGVVAIFANKMTANQVPTIFGDGTQTRDFVYVGDVAEANLLAMEANESGVYNIGFGKETTVNEIFNVLKETLGVDIEPEHGPPVKGEVQRICLNIEKAVKGLGWSPKTGLREGIEKFVKSLNGKEGCL
jgi:UDP-glucose 4-epimerase